MPSPEPPIEMVAYLSVRNRIDPIAAKPIPTAPCKATTNQKTSQQTKAVILAHVQTTDLPRPLKQPCVVAHAHASRRNCPDHSNPKQSHKKPHRKPQQQAGCGPRTRLRRICPDHQRTKGSVAHAHASNGIAPTTRTLTQTS